MQQQDNHEYPFLYQRQTCHQVQPNQATYQKRQKCQPDRKSGSAGMPRPRSTLFPYTTLFRSLHFSKLFLILKSGVNHTSRGSIRTSTLPIIKLRKCSSKIITSILSFISGRLATKSNQIKQLIRNGRSASLQRTFKKSFTSFSHSTRNKTRDGLIRVRNIRALNGRFNTSITHAYSIVIGSKHITLNATGGGFLTASKQFRHGATSKSRSNTASNSTKHKSPHL